MTTRAILFFSLLLAASNQLVGQEKPPVHSFHFRDTELRTALDSLARWYNVHMVYLDRDVKEKDVSAECMDCNFRDALSKVLEEHDLYWKMLNGQFIIQRQTKPARVSGTTVAGSITDSLTREWLMGATVLLRDISDSSTIRWCATNEFGFFSLRNVAPGNYRLSINSVGYRTFHQVVTVFPDSLLVINLPLSPQEVQLKGYTVEGERSTLDGSEAISHGVFIPAASSDQNQYFLEGVRIYSPSHYGGVMTTFNEDALRDIHTVAGGAPPYYGGRIGGVLDVSLRNGSQEKVSGSAGVGSLGSTLLIEGPVADRTSFVTSGRKGYPDIFLPRHSGTTIPSDLTSYELMAKVTRFLQGNSQLSLSGYWGHDVYENTSQNQNGLTLRNNFGWNNAAAHLRWVGIVSPSLFFQTSLAYTNYGFDMEHSNSASAGLPPDVFKSNYALHDIAARAHAEYYYDEHHTVRGGVDLIYHTMTATVSEFSTQIGSFSLDRYSPWELSVYFQDQWRLVPSVSAEFGARATSFIGGNGSFSAVDPRFSLLMSLSEDMRLFSSFTSVHQFIHPYRKSGAFLFYPSIFFYPSTRAISPSTALQISLGLEMSFRDNLYTILFQPYYRITQNFHEFAFDTALISSSDISESILLGESAVYGSDFTMTKRTGDITGSIRYSLTWTRNRFAEVNGGESFVPRLDRRHEFYASLSYSPLENWTLGFLALLSSNETTRQDEGFLNGSGTRTQQTPSVELTRMENNVDLNGGRLPGFQRVELRIQHRFSWWDTQWQATLRMVNGYGLVDPYLWEPQLHSDSRLRWGIRLDNPDLLPLYPVIALNVRF